MILVTGHGLPGYLQIMAIGYFFPIGHKALRPGCLCTWLKWIFSSLILLSLERCYVDCCMDCCEEYCHWCGMFDTVLRIHCASCPISFEVNLLPGVAHACRVYDCDLAPNIIPCSAWPPFSYTAFKLIENACQWLYTSFEIKNMRALIFLHVFNFYAIFLLLLFVLFSLHISLV